MYGWYVLWYLILCIFSLVFLFLSATLQGMAIVLIKLEIEWNKSVDNRTTRHFMALQSQETRCYTYVQPPKFSDSPKAWFKHFDINNSECLSQKEAIHGLYVTLNANTSE